MIAVNQTRTFVIERHKNTRKWWAREDSNLQPDRYERWLNVRKTHFISVFGDAEALQKLPTRPNLGRNWGGTN
jgi:hypothetical protein